MNKAIGYDVIDKKTGVVVKSYGEGKRALASSFANKKDVQHGAIRYQVKTIWSEGK